MANFNNGAGALHKLIGRDLAAVTFIRDYIQFDFDGYVLTAITDPTLIVNGTTYQFESAEFRDRIIRCIGLKVSRVTVADNHSIEVLLGEKHKIYISLASEDMLTGEAAMLTGNEGLIFIWIQPGASEPDTPDADQRRE